MAQDFSPDDQQVGPKERLRLVQAAIDAQDAAGLCDALGSWMKQSKSAFKVVLQTTGPILAAQGDPTAVAQLLLSSLLHLQHHPEQHSSAVKHLLLEMLPTSIPTSSPVIRALALRLFSSYCNPLDAKLSVKVASAFRLTREDVGPQWGELEAFVGELLQDRSNYTAAVRLMLLFEGLDAHVDIASTLFMLVGEGQAGLAEKWAATLDHDWQVAFIEACVAGEQLKAAARAVRHLGLSRDFPNIEALYRQRSLGRLMDKRLWPVALTFVGADAELQVTLLRHMVTAGQLALANEYRKQLHLPEDVLAFDPAQLAADEAARREAYLQLPTDSTVQILNVTDAAGLQQAASILTGVTVIGMDVEWKPSHMVGQTTPAALLQVAAGDAVLLLDLLALCGGPPELQRQLDEVLIPVMTSPQVLKVGFGLSGDLSKLAGSWPAAGCWREVGPTLDLLPLWVAAGLRAKPGASTRALGSAGLSTLCGSLLGKPLDKACQMSDWEQRPLSAAQQQYAALDAWVLPRLLEALLGVLGEVEGARLVAQHKGQYVSRRLAVKAHPPNVPGSPDAAAATAAPDAGTAAPPGPTPSSGGDGTVPGPAGGLTGSNSSSTVSHSTSSSSLPASSSRRGGVDSSMVTGTAATPLWDGDRSSSSQDDQQAARVLALLQQHGLQHCLQPRPPDSSTAVAAAAPPAAARGSPSCIPTAPVTSAAAGAAPVAAAAGGGSSCAPAAPRRVKSMVLSAGDMALVVVAPAGSTLDLAKVAAACGCSRKAVKLVSAAQCLQLTGFAPGHVPPLGHTTRLPVLLDWRLGYTRPPSWPLAAMPSAPMNAAAEAGAEAAAVDVGTSGAGDIGGAAGAGPGAETAADKADAAANTARAVAAAGMYGAVVAGTGAELAAAEAGVTAVGETTQRLSAATVGPSATAERARRNPTEPPAATGTLAAVTPEAAAAAAAVTGALPEAATTKAAAGATCTSGCDQVPAIRPLATAGGDAASRPATEQQEGPSCSTAGPRAPVVAAAVMAAAPAAASSSSTAAGRDGAEVVVHGSCSPGNVQVVEHGDVHESHMGTADRLQQQQIPLMDEPLVPGPTQQGQQQEQDNRSDLIACGCGVPSLQLVLSPQQLALLTQGRVVDVVGGQEEGRQGLVQQQQQQQQQQEGSRLHGASNMEGRQAPCFLCDGMLGRLCRWLRVLGVDAEFAERRTAVDETAFAAAVFQRTLQERRLFLTRDTRLAARRDVGGGVVLLASDDPQQQLAQVVGQYGLRFDAGAAMSRCSACNAADFVLIVPREAAAGLVPARVFDMVEEFWRCGGCGKVFWQGPKSQAAMQLLEGLLAGERRATPLQSLSSTKPGGGAVHDV